MIPPTTAAPPSTALPASGAPGGESGRDLGWLLQDFLTQVPGTQAAFLVSRDGLRLAAAGLTLEEADHGAAVASAVYSAAAAAGAIKKPATGDVQQVVIQHDTRYVILMSTPSTPGTAASRVGCVLGVLAAPEAHTRLVGEQMTVLIHSVAAHLVTATRPGIPTVKAPTETTSTETVRSETVGPETADSADGGSIGGVPLPAVGTGTTDASVEGVDDGQ